MKEIGKQMAVYTDMKSKCGLQKSRKNVALFRATLFFGGKWKSEKKKKI